VPAGSADVIRNARSKISMNLMKREEIVDFAEFFKKIFARRNIDVDKKEFKWTEIRWLRYTKQLGIVHIKTYHKNN